MKRILTASLIIASNLMATTFEVTVNCHIPVGFSHKQVTVEVDIPNGYHSDAKRWANENGKRLCKQYAPSGYWFDGIYNISEK